MEQPDKPLVFASERSKKIRLTKLRAKLSNPEISESEKTETESLIAQIEALPIVSGPSEKKSPPEPEKLLEREELEEAINTGWEALTEFGVDVPRSKLGEKLAMSGFMKMAKRKGWSSEKVGEWGLIWMGLGLMILAPVPKLVKAYFGKKKEETADEARVSPDASHSSE